eukprot:s1469_g7.t2
MVTVSKTAQARELWYPRYPAVAMSISHTCQLACQPGFCRFVAWTQIKMSKCKHEAMPKSQKLPNLSKQTRTVAQSASEYLMP